MNNFKMYNKCLVSNLAPHETPDTHDIKALIKKEKAMLARWTDGWNNSTETEWWYLIKEGNWDLSTLKSHDRNEINKGTRNFSCKLIEHDKYIKDMYNIYINATKEYSNLSNNIISFDKFNTFDKKDIIVGAFDNEDNTLAAYACVFYYNSKNTSKALNLSVIKIDPAKKKKSPSAALMNYICSYFLNEKKVDYICDGERSIRHITNFQSYLEKYFGFKKIYCRLNVVYCHKMKILINVLYPFRKIIKLISRENKFIYNVYCILRQEEICRTFK